MHVPAEFLTFVGIGLAAQIVDGALGMAYGVVTASLLLAFGLPPAAASASVHSAEVAVTGVSGLSHGFFGNIDKRLLLRLALPGVFGGLVGALLLGHFQLLPWLKPVIALYLMGLGVRLLIRVWRRDSGRPHARGMTPLAIIAGFMDAVAGGGWGSLTTSSLMARHHEPRIAIGTAHAAKFFVSVTIALVFLNTLGFQHAPIVLGLMTGGVIAAPFAAWVTKHIPARLLMGVVGVVVILLGIRTIAVALGWSPPWLT